MRTTTRGDGLAGNETFDMRITVTLDDRLLARASEAMGTTEWSVLLHEGLTLVVQREAARRLIALGGSAPDLALPARRQSRRTPKPRDARKAR